LKANDIKKVHDKPKSSNNQKDKKPVKLHKNDAKSDGSNTEDKFDKAIDEINKAIEKIDISTL
jgi:hypothetical protein